MDTNYSEQKIRRVPLKAMTTSRKLWMGFGTLTLLLVIVCVAVLVRLRSIEEAVEEMSSVARPRSAAAKEMEINVVGYALAVRTYIQTDDPKFRQEAAKKAADVQCQLAEYERLATTDRQRKLATRFAGLWREFKGLGQTVLDSKDRPLKLEDSTRFADLRIGLEQFLDDEMQPEAVESYDAHKDETFQNLRAIVSFVLILLIVGVVIAVATSWAVGVAVVKGERHIAEQAELLRTTLASIGDAVITTDLAGRVTNLNAVAQSLTGWTNAQAQGESLDTVFCIVNETTRQPVHNPATRALEEGVIVGLANHTILIAKDGTERPIDDSAAPIRTKGGEIVGCVLVFRDITERKQIEQQRGDAVARTESVLNNVVDGIITIDERGVVESFNPSAERLFSYQPEEVVGQNIKVLMGEPYHSKHDGYLANYMRTGQAKIIGIGRGVEGRRKDGSTFPMDLGISEFLLGERRYFVGVVRDITERKQAEERLRQLAAELSEADRRKDEFLATLAHELRNPLAPICNGLELMKLAGGQTADVEQTRSMIERQITQMVRLVDDLMDVSRISRGKLELRKEQISLVAVLNSAVETSRPLIEAMGHEFTVTLPKQPLIVDADMTRLAQVFLNLLNNAAKYSARGGHIQLNVEREGSDVVVTVKDTGIGIAADQLPRIFEMFMQVDRSLEKSQGGLGIGLTLVKRLVEMHGGRVEAKSEGPGKGSEFVVRLPVVIEASKPQGSGGEEEPAAQKSSLRILIVDDNKDAADSLGILLRFMGNDTRTAYDGQEGVDVAAEFRPNVVLFDIGMPKLNGYEACRRIREQPWGNGVVLIAVTGWGQAEDRRRSHEAGFDHHMVKPVDPQTLMKMLAGLQEVKQVGRAASGSP